jgi:hypothetical protein
MGDESNENEDDGFEEGLGRVIMKNIGLIVECTGTKLSCWLLCVTVGWCWIRSATTIEWVRFTFNGCINSVKLRKVSYSMAVIATEAGWAAKLGLNGTSFSLPNPHLLLSLCFSTKKKKRVL